MLGKEKTVAKKSATWCISVLNKITRGKWHREFIFLKQVLLVIGTMSLVRCLHKVGHLVPCTFPQEHAELRLPKFRWGAAALGPAVGAPTPVRVEKAPGPSRRDNGGSTHMLVMQFLYNHI